MLNESSTSLGSFVDKDIFLSNCDNLDTIFWWNRGLRFSGDGKILCHRLLRSDYCCGNIYQTQIEMFILWMKWLRGCLDCDKSIKLVAHVLCLYHRYYLLLSSSSKKIFQLIFHCDFTVCIWVISGHENESEMINQNVLSKVERGAANSNILFFNLNQLNL